MPNADNSDLDNDVTVELAVGAPEADLPASREDLIEQLPGLEPERHVTDWGRSERIEHLVNRTV